MAERFVVVLTGGSVAAATEPPAATSSRYTACFTRPATALTASSANRRGDTIWFAASSGTLLAGGVRCKQTALPFVGHLPEEAVGGVAGAAFIYVVVDDVRVFDGHAQAIEDPLAEAYTEAPFGHEADAK